MSSLYLSGRGGVGRRTLQTNAELLSMLLKSEGQATVKQTEQLQGEELWH